ncbi:LysR family transcriptional regulator [Saccharomonospora glauca]|uniref:Transcriptional regulator n=1 Tax=Saccharomonospora glauca K62 TaxID=928724 RepID=I1D242_9PSEU|nr:LysR family transcriptional regulator [Saccharomonospora glauca]EIE99016.1 transcriptional regulator [Saccharomonospora glauca K62]
MELQQLRYVLAVAETRSFTRAAERCHVVQSALSHQIARLERELGGRLFERTSRRVRLTAAGEAFLPAARQCLDAAERAAAAVAAALGEVRGQLNVGVIPTVAAVDLPSLLKEFRMRYPKARVALRVGSSPELAEQVRRAELDLAFLGLPATTEPRGVEVHEFGRDRHVAVVAPGHPLAEAEEIELSRLASEVFVDFPAGSAGRAQSDLAFEAAGIDREVALEVGAVDIMVELVRRGLGVTMLPSTFVTGLSGIATIPVSDAPQRVEYLVWSRSEPRPAATAFLGLLGLPTGS